MSRASINSNDNIQPGFLDWTKAPQLDEMVKSKKTDLG